MIERMNRTINNSLSKHIKKHQNDWDSQLDYISMAYNATPRESIGLTPHRMVYGKEMTLSLDLITDPVQHEEDIFLSQIVLGLDQKLRAAN